MDSGEYVQLWGDDLKPPVRVLKENQGSFTIITKENLRRTAPGRIGTLEKPDARVQPQEELRKTLSRTGVTKNDDENHFNERLKSPVDFNVFLLEAGNKEVRGVLELSTLHHDVIDQVRTRIICLFDVSGSMLHKCGRKRKDSKLTTLRKMIIDLVDSLEEDGDYIGLVTFGESAKEVIPLSIINQASRESVKKAIDSMDQSISIHTDLSAGLSTAIDMLKQCDDASKYLYRNSIIIFSDGEINHGITEVDKLVHMTRDKIRESKPEVDLKSDQWLSISCVTTGGNVSEAMYLLSKFCGNDAYYYVDSNSNNPQTDMMTPVLLRKSAIVQFLSLTVFAENGAELNSSGCTREHSIRKRYRKPQPSEDTKICFYLHDLPAGSQKHFAIALDMEGYRAHESSALLSVELEFVDSEGNIRTTTKQIKYEDILTPTTHPTDYEKCLVLLAKNDIRLTMQAACRKTANMISEKHPNRLESLLEDGQTDIQKLMENYAERARKMETKFSINQFGQEVITNMNKLLETITKSQRGDGHKWTKIKAVSSSIARETPNVANLVVGAEHLCPLPAIADCATDRMRALAMKIFAEQKVENEMSKSYREKISGAASDIVQSIQEMVDTMGSLRNQPSQVQHVQDPANVLQSEEDDEEEEFMKIAKRIALS